MPCLGSGTGEPGTLECLLNNLVRGQSVREVIRAVTWYGLVIQVHGAVSGKRLVSIPPLGAPSAYWTLSLSVSDYLCHWSRAWENVLHFLQSWEENCRLLLPGRPHLNENNHANIKGPRSSKLGTGRACWPLKTWICVLYQRDYSR